MTYHYPSAATARYKAAMNRGFIAALCLPAGALVGSCATFWFHRSGAQGAKTDPTEAMTALRSLKASTDDGVLYPDYLHRLGDAKAPVDRYLAVAPKEQPLRAAISETLARYVFAVRAWDVLWQGPFTWAAVDQMLPPDPSAEGCSIVRMIRDTATREKAGRRFANPVDQQNPVASPLTVGPFFACAGDKLAEAEKPLGAAK